MEYKDIRTGMLVCLGATGIEGTVVEVDPRRLEDGNPVRVQVRLPVTGLHKMWVAAGEIDPRRGAK
jgi:hypothetical protein